MIGMARFDEAITEAKRAQQLDPVGLGTNWGLASVYINARRYNEAIVQNQKTLELYPNNPTARALLGDCYTLLGRYPEALAEYRKLGDITAFPTVGYPYAVSGQQAEARKVARKMESLSHREYLSPIDMAYPHAGLADHEKALELLERAYRERDARMFLLKVDPFLDNVRSDPRFQDLLRRMNFPP